MNKIKLVKQNYQDINDNDFYNIEGVEDYCEVTKDLDSWMATMYSMGDYVEHKVWAQTPHLAGDKLLKNIDLCLGMEVA